MIANKAISKKPVKKTPNYIWPKMVLILDNIRSVHNVGSIFRTAECAGVKVIYCIGTTPTPTDRFRRNRADFAKVSLGAENFIDWQYYKTAIPVLRKLKKEGFLIVSLEQGKNSINYKTFKPKNNVALIVGNEVDGVSKNLLKVSDICVEIPMKGKKESLNVAVATGIAIFKMLEN